MKGRLLFLLRELKSKFHWLSLWVPVLIQMGLIFYFSSQPGGSPALEQFPLPAGLGHFLGYGLLGLLLYRAFNDGFASWSITATLRAFFVGLFYAISDEVHQLFVPGREASVFDLLIDAAGLVIALVAIFAINLAIFHNIKLFTKNRNR